MKMMEGTRITAGPYTGFLSPAYANDRLIAQCADITALMRRPLMIHSEGRNRVVTLAMETALGVQEITIKQFSRPFWLKGLWDGLFGSKAARSWSIACHLAHRGVGTPAPVGYLERWRGGSVRDCYYLSIHQSGMTTFRDELIRLYRKDPLCSRLMSLLQCVGDAVRGLHTAGVLHYDLGNQNILLRRYDDKTWGDVQFIDLNRARFVSAPTLRQRARDLSRLTIPSDFMRVFEAMYLDARPPKAFKRWQRFFRRLFAWHTHTRRWRHPWRERRIRRKADPASTYPPEKDIWIWDDRSAQAISTMLVRDRNRYYPVDNIFRIAASSLRSWQPLTAAYRRLKQTAYSRPVAMEGRLAMAMEPNPSTMDRELQLLEGLGPKVPVLLRFYHHQTDSEWAFTTGVARQLKDAGHSITIALVQDRRAVLEPGRWMNFTENIVGSLADIADWVEVGHAINRVKWGLWGLKEYEQLLTPMVDLAARHPRLRWMGPAVIDFEYPFLMAALQSCAKTFRFQALSHHLYVDRRGAPENRQGRYSAEEKFIMGKAIAETQGIEGGRFVVSEVNWPLKGTGVYSPVGSPYVMPGIRRHDPNVSEKEYGNYMVRYCVSALASGMVERVYWWRLVAHGFGLVDDRDPGGEWRIRPAYHQWSSMIRHLGNATFIRRLPSPPQTVLVMFQQPSGRNIVVGYAVGGDVSIELPFTCEEGYDGIGEALACKTRNFCLTGHPVFFLGVTLNG